MKTAHPIKKFADFLKANNFGCKIFHTSPF